MQVRPKVSFIHIRDHMVLNGKKTVVSSTGGATIGYIRNGDSVIFTIAGCKAPDVFNRKKGRLITSGRLEKNKRVFSIHFPKESTRSELKERLLNEYYDWIEFHQSRPIPEPETRLW